MITCSVVRLSNPPISQKRIWPLSSRRPALRREQEAGARSRAHSARRRRGGSRSCRARPREHDDCSRRQKAPRWPERNVQACAPSRSRAPTRAQRRAAGDASSPRARERVRKNACMTRRSPRARRDHGFRPAFGATGTLRTTVSAWVPLPQALARRPATERHPPRRRGMRKRDQQQQRAPTWRRLVSLEALRVQLSGQAPRRPRGVVVGEPLARSGPAEHEPSSLERRRWRYRESAEPGSRPVPPCPSDRTSGFQARSFSSGVEAWRRRRFGGDIDPPA